LNCCDDNGTGIGEVTVACCDEEMYFISNFLGPSGKPSSRRSSSLSKRKDATVSCSADNKYKKQNKRPYNQKFDHTTNIKSRYILMTVPF
jgi:hypothetical protein